MAFTRLKLAMVLMTAGLLCIYFLPNQLQQDTYIKHGLRVFVDPDTGEFQRPDSLPTQAKQASSLIATAKSLFSTSRHPEIRSHHANGGYHINLEQHFRPSRKGASAKTGSL